jgi:transcriptional regulator with XRE-family HTH domain
MTIDEVLKTIRKELNISQEQLARDLNISFTTINRWENGRSVPSRLARMRLSEYCATKGVSKEIMAQLERV